MVPYITKSLIFNIVKFNIIKKRKSTFSFRFVPLAFLIRNNSFPYVHKNILSLFISCKVLILTFRFLICLWSKVEISCIFFLHVDNLNYSNIYCRVIHFHWLAMTPCIHVFFSPFWAISLVYFLFLWTNTTFSES